MKNRINTPSSFNLFVTLLITTLLIACEKEEIAIDPHSEGSLTTTAIQLDPDYKYQVFFCFKMRMVNMYLIMM